MSAEKQFGSVTPVIHHESVDVNFLLHLIVALRLLPSQISLVHVDSARQQRRPVRALGEVRLAAKCSVKLEGKIKSDWA